MSFQTGNHGFPELGEDEEDLDLPVSDPEWERDIEKIDPFWKDFIGEDMDLEPDWYDDERFWWDDY